MPTFVSEGGIWKPAKERAYVPADPAKGREEGFIYEGPDRAAAAMLAAKGVTHLGQLARTDPDLIRLARDQGMSVDEFLKLHASSEAAVAVVEDKKKTFVQTHPQPKAKPGVKHQGGRSPDRPESESGSFGSAPGDPAPVSGQTAAATA